MVSAINSALSGLSAATQRFNVSVSNLVNQDSTQSVDQEGSVSNTPYVPQQVVQSSQTTGGVTTSTKPVTPPSVPVNDPSNAAADANGITQYPNVDPAQQLIQGQIASYDAQGNISLLKVEKNLFQSVLNIVS